MSSIPYANLLGSYLWNFTFSFTLGWILILLKQTDCFIAVCLVSLSCWKIHPHFDFRVCLESNWFLYKILTYWYQNFGWYSISNFYQCSNTMKRQLPILLVYYVIKFVTPFNKKNKSLVILSMAFSTYNIIHLLHITSSNYAVQIDSFHVYFFTVLYNELTKVHTCFKVGHFKFTFIETSLTVHNTFLSLLCM